MKTYKPPADLGFGIHLIDGQDLGYEGRTGTYVLLGEQLTLIETGPSMSNPSIKAGLQHLGLALEEVRYIIVTHIHLDHAGGAGLLLKDCPNATVVVHPRGQRHLADPSRLIASAKMVYGARFEELFAPILPVPEERLMVKHDGETLQIDPERTLTFIDSPGHAAHHFSIYDPVSKGIFTGDTAGIYYHQLGEELPFFLPSTSPNQFDPEAMVASMDRFAALKPERLYFGHFGMYDQPEETFAQVKAWLPRFVQKGVEVLKAGQSPQDLAQALTDMVRQHLDKQGVPREHLIYNILRGDMNVNAMGIADYLAKKAKTS